MSWAPRTPVLLGLLALGTGFLTLGCDPSSLSRAPKTSPAPLVVPASPALVSRAAPSAAKPTRDSLAVEPGGFDPGEDGRLSLREFYSQKYPEEERARVRQALEQVLGRYDAAELDEATAEILAFHHVVYHRTRSHDLEKNHAVVRRVEPKLRELASRHEVPLRPILAIVSWENSGDLTQVSWANAAGLGQMTWGAVERAHSFASEEAARLGSEADALRSSGNPADVERAAALEARAADLDVASRHKELAHAMGVTDERMIVEANLEDAVLFFKYLLQSYGGREDLAISAYHNGVLNNDDILFDYLVRRGEPISRPGADRSEFLQALDRRDVTYLDVWRDTRSRQMLNGLRTVEGEVTTPSNAAMALGDESDLYPWKVLASLAALEGGPEFTARTVARYADRWDVVEVRGLPEHRSFAAFEDSAALGHLVRLVTPVQDVGIRGRAPAGTRGEAFSYYATPELAGYLADLTDRLREVTGKPGLRLPVANLSSASCLGANHVSCAKGDTATHLRGVAVDLVPGALDPASGKALEGLIWSDYLMDKVFLSREQGSAHLVLNPRRGEDFMTSYRKRTEKRAAGMPEPQ